MNSSSVSINNEILLETFQTVYEFAVGPLNLIDTDIRTPSFHLNSTNSVLCYIILRYDIDNILIRLVVETNTGISMAEPVLRHIVLKNEEGVLCSSVDGEMIEKSVNPEQFDWYMSNDPGKLMDELDKTGMITIHCVITQVCSVVKKYTRRGRNDVTATKDELYDRLNKMFTGKEFADVTLNVGNRKFSAHKAILTRSPVFAAMFEHEMAEKNENIVNIKDVDPEVFAILLKYLYLGEMHLNISESSTNRDLHLNLIIAADMYQVEELKTTLAEILIKYVDVNNAVDYLILADKYNIPTIRNACLTFIGAHPKEIKDTDAFKRMIVSHTALATEILCFFMSQKIGPEITERI